VLPDPIVERAVIHFPGFEPVDAAHHHERFRRAGERSAAVWSARFEVGPLERLATGVARFTVAGTGNGWRSRQVVTMIDHHDLMIGLAARPWPLRLGDGVAAWARALGHGGHRYFTAAWRFGVYFLYPFVVVFLAALLVAMLALLPALAGGRGHLLWSLPLAGVVAATAGVALLERAFVFHLFDHWRTGWALAALDDPAIDTLIERHVAALRQALKDSAPRPVTISAHSIGASFAVQALGRLIEREPGLLDGRVVQIATLGSTLLQAAVLAPAERLRDHIRALLSHPSVAWIDVQNIGDVINFFRADFAGLVGLAEGIAPPEHFSIRARHILAPDHFAKVRWDFLRIHRQYLMGSDRPSRYDAMLFLFGPLPPMAWAGKVSPIDATGRPRR